MIARFVLWHVAATEPAVLAAEPEGVNQMRVGVRRMRAVISIFSKLLRDKQTDQIKRDLKWLATKLGSVRDMDVFLESKVKPLNDAETPIVGLPELANEVIYWRTMATLTAKQAVTTRRRFLIFNTLQWIEDGNWLKQPRSCGDPRSNHSLRVC